MGILEEISSKQRRFFVGGREVLFVDADFPVGKSPAAVHILHLVEALCAYAEREQLPRAAEALMEAVQRGQGHRFRKWLYRIALSEAPVGRRHCVTLTACFSFFDTHTGERIERFHRLETRWDTEGALQMTEKRRKRERNARNRKENEGGRQRIS